MFGVSTLERWYYAARKADDPVATLRNRLRARLHFPSLSQTVIDTLTQQYREHAGWSAQLHFDNLCAAFKGCDTVVPSYPTVRRYPVSYTHLDVYKRQDQGISIDGKTMKNAIDEDGNQTHILSAIGHETATCFAQKKVDSLPIVGLSLIHI